MRVFTLIIILFIFGNVGFSQRFHLNDFSNLSPWTSSGTNAALNSSSASSGYTNPVSASGGNNVIFTNCGTSGTLVTLTSPAFNFSGKTGIIVGIGNRRSGSGLPLDFSYSIGGGSFTSIGILNNTAWTYDDFPLSALDNQTNVVFRISFTTTQGGACGTAPNNRIDDFAIGENNSLPVDFKNFNLKIKKNNTFLSFSTASETNNDYFTIERSVDGLSFDAIGEIKGAGNSTEERHYEFIDKNPLPGINYYRIKQTDFDGQYSYSEIRSVRHAGKGNVAISPRSTDGRLDISTEMESYDVAVYSSAGQEVARFAALVGHQTVSIETLQAGVYFVKVMSGSESETVTVVKF
jgi:hypothetical protein